MTSVTIEGNQEHVNYLTNLLKSNGDRVVKELTRPVWVKDGQQIVQRDLVLTNGKKGLDK